MAPTKSAGRVSIRVLPDSTRFRADLKKSLDRIEKTLTVKIQVVPILTQKQLTEMKKRIEALAVKIKPIIDLNVPADEIERIKKQIEAMDPEIDVDLNMETAATAARIAALTRTRLLNIVPVIAQNAARNFSRHLAGLAGAGIIATNIRDGLAWMREIDVHAVRISRLMTIIGGVAASIGSLVQGTLLLGDGLIKTLGILTVAPALLSSMGIAVAVFISAFRDMSTVLADLGPRFGELRQIMSRTFWNEAAAPIREMTNVLFPTMAEKITESSRALGSLVGQIARSYQLHVTPERLALMWDRVNESMWTVQGAVDPIIEAFTTLGLHGTKYLDRLSRSIVKLSEDFNKWIQFNDQNGNLERWTEEAISSFKELGGIIKGVWNVFGALNDAAKAAGGPTLETMHRNLDNLARMMDSPMFQEALTRVFRGMNSAIRDILGGLRDIGPDMAIFSHSVETGFGSVGRVIRTLLGYLGDIMAHPAVNKGLTDFFHSLERAAIALKPAIEPLAIAMGGLLTVLGSVLENVAELVAVIMEEWGPALDDFSKEFDTLIDPLGDLAQQLVRDLTPAIEALIYKGLIPMVQYIRDDLMPHLKDWVDRMGPELGEAITNAVGFINIMLPVLGWLVVLVLDIVLALAQFINWLASVAQFLSNPAQNFALMLHEPLRALGEQFYLVFEGMKVNWDAFVVKIGDGVLQVLGFFNELNILSGLSLEQWKTIINGIHTQLEEDWDTFKTNLLSTANIMWEDLKKDTGIKLDEWARISRFIFRQLITDTDKDMGEVNQTVNTGWERTKQTTSQKLGEMLRDVQSNLNQLPGMLSYIWETGKQRVFDRLSEMRTGIEQKVNEVLIFIGRLPQTIAQKLSQYSLFGSGQSIIQGFLDGMVSMVVRAAITAEYIMRTIRSFFPFSPAKRGPFSGMGYTTHSGAAMVRDWAKGMASEMGTVKQVTGKIMKTTQLGLNSSGGGEDGDEFEGSNGNVTFNVYNPVREPTSRTVAKTAAEIRLGGTIG